MTDERLRRLERRVHAAGSVADEVAFLLARVRTGDLDEERLRLAAFCGHEAARLALGDQAPVRATCLGDWIRGLEWWGPDVAIRGFAEACLANGESDAISAVDRGYAERQLQELAEQVRAGTFPVEAEAVFPHTAQAKVLVLASFRQRSQPRYVDASEPEIVRARAEVWQRVRHAGHLTYNHTDREPGSSWAHHFLHVASDGEERWRRCSASRGWEPPAGSFRRPPGRRGIFDALASPAWEAGQNAWPAAELRLRAWALSSAESGPEAPGAR